MSIWTIKEKPPVLDKFCHLSLDAQKVMASLYRDFHQRKAELLSTRCNPSTGYQGSRYRDYSVSKQVDFGQYVEQAIYSGRTDSVCEDKSTYSDSPPVETQDFRLLSQFCREENDSPLSPCVSEREEGKQNSTHDVNSKQACVNSNHTYHTEDGQGNRFTHGSTDRQSSSLCRSTLGFKQTVSSNHTDHTGDDPQANIKNRFTIGSKQTVSFTDHTGDCQANRSIIGSTESHGRSTLGSTESHGRFTLGSTESQGRFTLGSTESQGRFTLGSTESQGRFTLGSTHPASISVEPTGIINSNGKGPFIYEVSNFDTDSSRNAKEMPVGDHVNDEQGIDVPDSVIQGIHADHDEPDVVYNASQALFSQDHDIADTTAVVRAKKAASRKPNIMNSTSVQVNSGSNEDITLCSADLNICTNNQNFIFKPVIIPLNSVSENIQENSRHLSENTLHLLENTRHMSENTRHLSENTQHEVVVNACRNNDFERTHNGKRRKTESKLSTNSTGDMLYKSKVKENVPNHKSRDIREFIQVSYPDVTYNRMNGQGSDITKQTDERPFLNDVISTASGRNADTSNCYDESPYPVHGTHSGTWNVRQDDYKVITGKRLDTKNSKFRVPVKSNKFNECSVVNGIVDISKLSVEVLGDILATILEAKEVVITLVYRNGSTQLRDCLFGSDKFPSMSKQYTQKDILDAVTAVRQGLSYRKAYAKYGVPVMTLQNRVSGAVDDLASPGRPTVIPHEVERNIAEQLKKAADMGFGITRQMLMVKIGRVVRRMGIKTPFKNGIPGKDWVSGFVSRHPDISLRKPLALSTCRARMLNRTIVDKFYVDLCALLNDVNLSNEPMKIWNIDETSVPLLHKPARVLGATGAKNIPGRVGNNRENVSVLGCINAAGGTIPPLVIVKGKTYKSLLAYNTENGVPGSIYTFQERAWMEDSLGELWFQGHFLKHCGPERPQVIVLDSHSSHETLGLIEAAIANDIILITFPPHTTQWLCPLDKTVFGPLSRHYSRICTEFMATSPNNIVNKWEWPVLFKQAYEKAFTATNIVSGFRKCGIFPVDCHALPSSALAPSEPFDISPLQCNQSVASSQPVASSSILPSTAVMSMSEYNAPESLCNPFESCVDVEPDTVLVASKFNPSVMACTPVSGDLPTPSVLPGTRSATVVSEAELINIVMSGDCPYSVDPTTGNIELQIEVSTDTISPPVSESPSLPDCKPSTIQWQQQVNTAFTLPMSVRKQTTSTNHRKLTTHRILTSKEIFDNKKEASDKKMKIKAIKEERKNIKEEKQKEKLLKKENKSVRRFVSPML